MDLKNNSFIFEKIIKNDFLEISNLFLLNQEKVFSNKNNYWEKDLSKNDILKLLNDWSKLKNNFLFVAKDSKNNIAGFFRVVLTNLDPIMKVKQICGIKELFISKKNISEKVLKNFFDFLFKEIKSTKHFTIHISPNDKKLLDIYFKLGFKKSYLYLGKEFQMIDNSEKINFDVKIASLNDLNQLLKLNLLFEKEESKIAGKDDFWRIKNDLNLLRKDILDLIKDKNSLYLILKNEKKKIIGFLNAILEIPAPSIKSKKISSMKILYVLPEYRNKKIASMLMTKMEEVMNRKTKYFAISVSPNNENAIKIYKSKGYVPLYLCLSKKI